MAETRALYEQVILDHNKNPRNFKVLEGADRHVEGFNPLCGDHFTVYLKFDGETIEDVSFKGSGCAISKSSASVMTTLLKGRSRSEARELFNTFHRLLTSSPDTPVDEDEVGKLMVFSGVREFPIRIKCASLAWYACMSGLDDVADAPVSTE
jgi:nitrogen fixation NifU-like protein